jgi:hypothetical protein
MDMDQATRFTDTMLRLYGHERSFEVGLQSEQELQAVAQAFVRRGCSVERDPMRLSLIVAAEGRA